MIPGVDQQPERAIIVTIGWFIRDALKLAKRYADEITLIDGQQLVTMMQRVQPQ
jgi:restriction endonuclease Mrr